MKSPVGNISSSLEGEVEEFLRKDGRLLDREKTAKRVKLTMEGLAGRIGKPGEVKMFGSFSNGFMTGSSDLDLVFAGELQADEEESFLKRIAELLPDNGFGNVTKIFQASTKLVKFTDVKTQMEVDFCTSNLLAVRNSELLGCYCEYDQRVPKLGRLVKEWAKRHELVGSADGYLNSYAYVLLVIYYLQQTTPPVLPNLQTLATEPVYVSSSKRGIEEKLDTKFCEDVKGIEVSKNEKSVSQLLVGFFHYYAATFDWQHHAVCIRLSNPGQQVDKFGLQPNVTEEKWYIEDPFDLKHNLAARCSRNFHERMLETMKATFGMLSTGGPWYLVCPQPTSSKYLLKCPVGQGILEKFEEVDDIAKAFLEHFEKFDIVKLHFPDTVPGNRNAPAFLEFASDSARRRAHTMNESYLPGCDYHLRLLVSTERFLREQTDELQAAGGSYRAVKAKAVCRYFFKPGGCRFGDACKFMHVHPTKLTRGSRHKIIPGFDQDTKVVIPDCVKTIGWGALSEAALTEVTIPDSVTDIGERAFHQCKSLVHVTIGRSVQTIGPWAFSETALTMVTIPDSVSDIQTGAFAACKLLTEVIIGRSVKTIGPRAFAETPLKKKPTFLGSETDINIAQDAFPKGVLKPKAKATRGQRGGQRVHTQAT